MGSDTLISKFKGGTTTSYRNRIILDGTQVQVFLYGPPATDWVVEAFNFEIGVEYKLLWTFDATNDVARLYINGEEQTVDTPGYANTINDSDADFCIGIDDSNRFDGKIYEAAIFDRVLTPTEGADITVQGLKP